MEIDRRQLIKGGLGLLGSGIALRTAGGLDLGHRGDRTSQVAPTLRFPGDPGAGRLYYGASVMGSLSLPALEQQLGGILTVRRSYYDWSQPSGVIGRARDDLSMGRFPLVSTKAPGTWASVASGAQDSWLLGLLRGLAALTKPVMLCLHHEPEEEAGPPGMLPANYVAMQQHAISLAQSVAPNTTIVPILMAWTFDPRSGRRPQDWLVPASQIFGVDVYNPWSPTNGLAWVELSQRMNLVLPYTGGKPIAIAEYGCRTDSSQPGRAATWMHNAFDYATQHGVMAMSYFDSDQHSRFGSWVLDGERTAAMRDCLHKSNVAHL